MEIRAAGVSDLDGLTSLLTEAFTADPLWSWAFPDADGLEAWWRFYIRSALRYPWCGYWATTRRPRFGSLLAASRSPTTKRTASSRSCAPFWVRVQVRFWRCWRASKRRIPRAS